MCDTRVLQFYYVFRQVLRAHKATEQNENAVQHHSSIWYEGTAQQSA